MDTPAAFLLVGILLVEMRDVSEGIPAESVGKKKGGSSEPAQPSIP